MSLTTQGFNSLTQSMGASHIALLQQNYDAQHSQTIEQESSVIDRSVEGNRLYEKPDGSIEIIEKPIGYVIGEQVLAPLVDSVRCLSNSFFSAISSAFSWWPSAEKYDLLPSLIPGASAEAVPDEDAEDCHVGKQESLRIESFKENGDQMREKMAYNSEGITYGSRGEHENAIKSFESLLEIAQSTNDQISTTIAYTNIGASYFFLKDYQNAIKSFEKQLDAAQSVSDQISIGMAYGNLGISCYSIGEYSKALGYFKEQLTTTHGDQGSIARAHHGIGISYEARGEYQKALNHAEKCLEAAQSINDQNCIRAAYEGIINAYNSLGEHEIASEYIEKHLGDSQGIDGNGCLGIAYGNIETA